MDGGFWGPEDAGAAPHNPDWVAVEEAHGDVGPAWISLGKTALGRDSTVTMAPGIS